MSKFTRGTKHRSRPAVELLEDRAVPAAFRSYDGTEHVPGTGTSTSNPRQQPNDITAFLDASMVYGSDPVTADALRTHSGGRLKTSPGPDGVIGTADDWLPFNNQTYFPGFHETGGDGTGAFHIANDSHVVSDAELFMAGDV